MPYRLDGVSASVLVLYRYRDPTPIVIHLAYNFYPYNLIPGVSVSVLQLFTETPVFLLIPEAPVTSDIRHYLSIYEMGIEIWLSIGAPDN